MRVRRRQSLDRLGHRQQRGCVPASCGPGCNHHGYGTNGEGYEQQIQGNQPGRTRPFRHALLTRRGAMKLEVTSAFPTLVGRFAVPDAGLMNDDLNAIILAEESKYASLGRSNIGGWHSQTDFLKRTESAVTAL